ncbi:MAG: CHAT domain-containing protein [Pseudanabaena sp. ELA607]
MATFRWWQKQMVRFGVAFLGGLLLAINSSWAIPVPNNHGVNAAPPHTIIRPIAPPHSSNQMLPLPPHRLMPLKGSRLKVIMAPSDPLSQSHLKNESKATANGSIYYQTGRYQEAIAIWETNLQNTPEPMVQIALHSNLALAYRQIGQISRAIEQWQAALEILHQNPVNQDHNSSERDQQQAAMLTEQGQLYSEIGQHQSAIAILEKALDIVQKPEYASKTAYIVIAAAAQGSLGNAYSAIGNLAKAQTALETSLALSKQLEAQNHPQSKLFRISTQNHLGNLLSKRASSNAAQAKNAGSEGDMGLAEELTQKFERDSQGAIAMYEDSVTLSASVGGLVEVQTLLNYSRILFGNSRPSLDTVVQAHRYHNKIQQILSTLPPSRDKVYSLIALAENMNLWRNPSPEDKNQPNLESSLTSINILESAITIARQIGDTRGESFAWGSLGAIAQAANKYDLAMEQTRRAMFLSQAAASPDSLYRWQWQLGKILRAQQNYPAAITAYEQAISSLQTIRGDIIAANKEVQFNFRDSIEPVYRELIDLFLMPLNDPKLTANGKSDFAKDIPSKVTGLSAQGIPLQNIRKTLDILELLKLAELQNFFGDDCVQVESDRFESTNNKVNNKANLKSALREDTAIVYTILLDNRTEIILRPGSGNLRLYHVPMGAEAMQKEVNQLRSLLEKRSTDEYLPQVEKLYKLMIEPIQPDLNAMGAKTLVFVNDGVLRKIPMAALYDGKKFLIEQYALATTPSLSLTSTTGLDRSRLRALVLGLTKERPPFPALQNVEAEVDAVTEILKGTKLLDAQFTVNELDKILRNESYPIVHMATHGRFGVDAETTFLQTYEGRMGIDQLDNLLRSRRGQEAVDLLTLSACQTAAGDNRSALGIAGVAVRAGVRSALASLWFINDQATVPLIKSFYENLNRPNLSKAQALQQAQIKMIGDPNLNHPAVWSSFVLIGNWL